MGHRKRDVQAVLREIYALPAVQRHLCSGVARRACDVLETRATNLAAALVVAPAAAVLALDYHTSRWWGAVETVRDALSSGAV